MKKLITLFVVLFSINVIGQISSNNYQSDVEKIILKHTTYKEATDILGKPDKVTSTEKKVVADIEIGGNVIYEYVNKGIRLLCKDKNPGAIIEEITLKGTFKDTLQNGLFIGMNENVALKICHSLYELKDKYLNTLSQYSDNTNVYFFTGNKWGKLIDEGKIQLGMTKEMVEDSWGKPKDINRTVGSWGVHEQWVYSNQYLYFVNGILTSWQD